MPPEITVVHFLDLWEEENLLFVGYVPRKLGRSIFAQFFNAPIKKLNFGSGGLTKGSGCKVFWLCKLHVGTYFTYYYSNTPCNVTIQGPFNSWKS